MLLTISTTHRPATELGFLLAKHPDRVQSFNTTGGTAYIWYPEATEHRCTAALLLDVDPVALARPARGSRRPEDFALGRYVNDRPYAATSLLAVALGRVFRSALNGASRERSELAGTPLPLEITVPAVPCPDPELVARLFQPLGWRVSADPVPLDPALGWHEPRYVDLRLAGRLRLAEALNQLYVLLPALDGAKHYWISDDEVDKLLRAGEGWLAGHPERELIARRYLHRQRSLTRSALQRLEAADDEANGAGGGDEAGAAARPLAADRIEAVLAALADSGARRVLDLGCGEGALLRELVADRRFTEIVGADVASRALQIAERRLHLDRDPPAVTGPDRGAPTRLDRDAPAGLDAPAGSERPDNRPPRVRLLQSALTYTDDRLVGYDAAVLMEVIEHLDEPRLPALERSVFGHAAPGAVVVTTPNADYNVHYENLGDRMRHHDHRFEFSRAEFAGWAERTAGSYGYTVEIRPVGEPDPEVGAPTQLALFRKAGPGPPGVKAAPDAREVKAVSE